MAFDSFLHITENKGIKPQGECQDPDYKNCFEIKSFSFGAENTINIGSQSGGGGAGKASFKEFNITKQTDSGSCGLFLACCSGTHFPDAKLTLRRSGQEGGRSGGVYMVFEFKMLMVQDIEWTGSDGDDVCEETVNCQYGAIKVTYKQQLASGDHGDVTQGMGAAEWSRIKNKNVFEV
jgi:type VI secretion system secreted protein Hcp